MVKRISSNPHEPKLASIAAILADPTRARMLSYLLSGECASAGELARAASVTPATASEHLRKLLEAGLITCEQRGRHRYFKLTDDEIAHALEAVALIAERRTHDQAWESPARSRLRFARCCYGHLAGKMGVEMFSRMLSLKWIISHEEGYILTDLGRQELRELGMDDSNLTGKLLPSSRLRLAYRCLDWSERKDHLAGKIPKALLDHFFKQGWLRRLDGERAIEITPSGMQHLTKLFPITIEHYRH
jgi:DNA-binding transcriptional ArsR family regulator